MPKNSTISLVGALAGNLAVAVVKFAASAVGGSSAMLTEAIHSVVDSLNQVLLLFGEYRGRRPATHDHPFGHGLETYFWTFIVALLIFAIGGALGIYEGIRELRHPTPVTHLGLTVTVLLVSGVLEGVSLVVSLVAARKAKSPLARKIVSKASLLHLMRYSKDPAIYEVLAENAAAILGLVFALAGVLATAAGYRMGDAIASVAIGVLLIAVAGFLMIETRSLLTGESAAPAVRDEIGKVLDEDARIEGIHEVRTMHMGPEDILVGATIDFRDDLSGPDLERAVDEITDRLQRTEPRITAVYLRPCAAAKHSHAKRHPQRRRAS
jgi:cation diffusion facilitator family transporter